MLWALHHDVAVDLLVSALVLIIHWGTFSDVMAARVASLMMSLSTSGAKLADLRVFDGAQGLVLEVSPRPERWSEIHAAWHRFTGNGNPIFVRD